MSTRIERLVERQVMLWRMRLAIVARRSEVSSRADIDPDPSESQAPHLEPPPKSGVRYRIPARAPSGKNTAAG